MIFFSRYIWGLAPPPPYQKAGYATVASFRSPEEWPNEDGRFRPPPPTRYTKSPPLMIMMMMRRRRRGGGKDGGSGGNGGGGDESEDDDDNDESKRMTTTMIMTMMMMMMLMMMTMMMMMMMVVVVVVVGVVVVGSCTFLLLANCFCNHFDLYWGSTSLFIITIFNTRNSWNYKPIKGILHDMYNIVRGIQTNRVTN